MKDLFSRQAAEYAKFRPSYPKALFDYLATLAPARTLAWDCGTGNGQAALALAESFDRVVATDPSSKQLESAVQHSKIEYRIEPSERTTLADASVDLVTVAQAFHWFREDEFFAEVRRVLKPEGVLALWSYSLAVTTPEVDEAVLHLYRDILGPYWEKERALVEEGYRSVSLPFPELKTPSFTMSADWTLEHLVGYLGTWSALQTYQKKQGDNPLLALIPRLQAAWGSQLTRRVSWPLSLRVARK